MVARIPNTEHLTISRANFYATRFVTNARSQACSTCFGAPSLDAWVNRLVFRPVCVVVLPAQNLPLSATRNLLFQFRTDLVFLVPRSQAYPADASIKHKVGAPLLEQPAVGVRPGALRDEHLSAVRCYSQKFDLHEYTFECSADLRQRRVLMPDRSLVFRLS
jgi:hypothetical protein